MKILKKIGEIIFPNHCLSCKKIISADGFFCESCWTKIRFITEPKCTICSYPFEFQGLNLVCGKCLGKRPSFDKVVTIFCYDKIIRKIIGNLKYRDKTFLAKKLALLLSRKAKDEINECELIIPVPLHKKRLAKRKFNQAVLLSKNIAKLFPQKQLLLNILLRNKDTIPQVKLRKKERENNLKNAFLVKEKYRKIIEQKTIILVDDVMTTGATVENCAKTLKKAGAKKVIVLTIAKTALLRT